MGSVLASAKDGEVDEDVVLSGMDSCSIEFDAGPDASAAQSAPRAEEPCLAGLGFRVYGLGFRV